LALAALLCAIGAAELSGASIIAAEVAGAARAGDFATADKLLKQYRAQRGVDAAYLEADSWVGRGRLFAKGYQAALDNAAEVRQMCLKLLTGRKLDAEPSLAEALGASLEVTGQALAALGRRDEAVAFLRAEMEKWRTTSIGARIQKNINLLSLEGKAAPPLDISQRVTGLPLRPLSAHAGHPVLLFFWAHWCSDCKQEIGVIQQIQAAYKAKGLEVIAPTQHYGYVAGGVDAPPSLETPYIAKIFSIYYSGLGNVEVPLSEANFVRYGVSTTPTLVLVNGAGIVTLYHPGLMTFGELSAALRR
jgi:thiol-disulfide isomerase/thioredoxin